MSLYPSPRSLSTPEAIVLRSHHHDRQVLAASFNPRTQSELTDLIGELRRQRLHLLIADLVTRINCEFPTVANLPPLANHLEALDTLSSILVVDAARENPLRGEMRAKLWQLREMLEPLSPSEYLRTSLELARSGFLDIPGRVGGAEGVGEPKLRSEMYALMVENVLLEELRSLRVLEREMDAVVRREYPGVAERELEHAREMSALLGIDDYRVRGKTRLANAVSYVRDAIVEKDMLVSSDVEHTINLLHGALVESLKTDLDVRRPAGMAMLLRPRMDDIPNFEVVTGGVLRGGQPSSRGLDWLVNYGVKLIIDLRGSDRSNQWEMPKCRLMNVRGDEREVEETIRFLNIPVEDFQTPSFEQVYQFVELLGAISSNGGVVFVHCKAGIGRTGTMIACWRIYNGEDVNSALAKESLYSDGGGGLRQEEFVRQFAALHADGLP